MLSAEEWKQLVLEHLHGNNNVGFAQQVVNMVGDVESMDDINRWLALAMNIRNNTPQPDRDGRTAHEIAELRRNTPPPEDRLLEK